MFYFIGYLFDIHTSVSQNLILFMAVAVTERSQITEIPRDWYKNMLGFADNKQQTNIMV